MYFSPLHRHTRLVQIRYTVIRGGGDQKYQKDLSLFVSKVMLQLYILSQPDAHREDASVREQ